MTAAARNANEQPVDFRRWLASQACAVLPQAMAPISFTLATLGTSHSVSVGAAMVSGMTACQVVCAIPLSRLGERHDALSFLQLLLLSRAATLTALTAAALGGMRPAGLVAIAALTGVANASIVVSLRLLLSLIVPGQTLRRSIAIAATANEMTFVIGPAIAAALGLVGGLLPLAVMTVASAIPILLLARAASPMRPVPHAPIGPPWSAAMGVWLFCYFATAMAVAVVEVGAVALALRYGLAATDAVAFTVCLCLASMLGGAAAIRVSGDIGISSVLGLLLLSAAGVTTIALARDPWIAAAGCVLVGLCLAPLSTFYSSVIEYLTPEGSRARAFSALRTAQGLGVIVTSLLLTVTHIDLVALVAACLVLGAFTLVLLCRDYVAQAVKTGQP